MFVVLASQSVLFCYSCSDKLIYLSFCFYSCPLKSNIQQRNCTTSLPSLKSSSGFPYIQNKIQTPCPGPRGAQGELTSFQFQIKCHFLRDNFPGPQSKQPIRQSLVYQCDLFSSWYPLPIGIFLCMLSFISLSLPSQCKLLHLPPELSSVTSVS